MVAKGIKNYFVNLKHLFTPIGTLALGIAIGLSVLLPSTVAAVRQLADTVAEVSGSASVDFSALWDCVSDAVRALDWSDPWKAIGTLTDKAWLSDTFTQCLHSLLPDGEQHIAQITEAVGVAVGTILVGVVLVVFFAVLGLLGGYVLTKFLVRRTTARRVWWKSFLASVIDTVLSLGYLAAVVWLQSVWASGVFISLLAGLILPGAVALTQAYLLYGWKKVPAKTVVNGKNIAWLWLTDVLVFLIACVFVLLAFGMLGSVAGLLLALPLLEIALFVIGLTAESYVIEKAGKLGPAQQEPPADGESATKMPT